jgi:hypothetical protein
MALLMEASVEVALKIEHDGSTAEHADLEDARLAVLLRHYMTSAEFRLKLGDVLSSMMRLDGDLSLGWVDDNVSYGITDVVAVAVSRVDSLKQD